MLGYISALAIVALLTIILILTRGRIKGRQRSRLVLVESKLDLSLWLVIERVNAVRIKEFFHCK